MAKTRLIVSQSGRVIRDDLSGRGGGSKRRVEVKGGTYDPKIEKSTCKQLMINGLYGVVGRISS